MATERTASAVPTDSTIDQWAGWIAALFGLWVLVSPFVLSGQVGSGTPLYSSVIAGIVALVLSAYAAYSLRSG